MTNSKKPTAKDIAYWEDIKQGMLDHADIVDNFEPDEREALDAICWASVCIDDGVTYLINDEIISLDTAISFCVSTDTLAIKYGWEASENVHKLEIVKLAVKLTAALRAHTAEEQPLSLSNAMRFKGMFYRVNTLLRTKPNQHQMKKFEEHGITWEGEVDEH